MDSNFNNNSLFVTQPWATYTNPSKPQLSSSENREIICTSKWCFTQNEGNDKKYLGQWFPLGGSEGKGQKKTTRIGNVLYLKLSSRFMTVIFEYNKEKNNYTCLKI